MSRSILVLLMCSIMRLCAHGTVLSHHQDANPRQPVIAEVIAISIVLILKVVLMAGCIWGVFFSTKPFRIRRKGRFTWFASTLLQENTATCHYLQPIITSNLTLLLDAKFLHIVWLGSESNSKFRVFQEHLFPHVSGVVIKQEEQRIVNQSLPLCCQQQWPIWCNKYELSTVAKNAARLDER